MTKSSIYKGIYTFSQNQGLVWSPVAHDAIHLSLIARQMNEHLAKQYYIIMLR